MNNLTQTHGAVNSAPVPAYPTTAATAQQKFTVAPHVRIDNAFIDAWMPKLAGTPWCVLTMLLRWKGSANEAHPRKSTLAAALGVTVPTVERAIKKLAKLGLIEVRAYFNPDWDYKQDANRYVFWCPPTK